MTSYACWWERTDPVLESALSPRLCSHQSPRPPLPCALPTAGQSHARCMNRLTPKPGGVAVRLTSPPYGGLMGGEACRTRPHGFLKCDSIDASVAAFVAGTEPAPDAVVLELGDWSVNFVNLDAFQARTPRGGIEGARARGSERAAGQYTE